MSNQMDRPEQLIDAYVDGVLDEQERSAFEDAMRTRPELAAEVALQAAIDDSLKRMFDSGDVGESGDVAGRIGRGKVGGLGKVLGIAAAVVIVGVGAWMYFGGGKNVPAVKIDPAGLYVAQVDGGFVPEEICTTPDAFEAWVMDRYGQMLRPREGDRVEFVGWSYTKILSPYSALLLARVDGREVIVLLDKARSDTGLSVEVDAPIELYRREIGKIVLYEMTPLGESVVLEMLFVPEGDG